MPVLHSLWCVCVCVCVYLHPLTETAEANVKIKLNQKKPNVLGRPHNCY